MVSAKFGAERPGAAVFSSYHDARMLALYGKLLTSRAPDSKAWATMNQ